MTDPQLGADEQAAPDALSRANARRRWLFGAVAATAGLAGAGLAWWGGRWDIAQRNEKPALWDLAFPTPGHQLLSMRSMLGQRLLLNFWATWCPPCVEELPLLDKFYRENAPNGWQVLGLAVDQAAAVTTFLRRTPVRFPIALAGVAGIDMSKSLGNLLGGLPFTVVFGPDGQIVHRKMGRVSSDDLKSWRSVS